VYTVPPRSLPPHGTTAPSGPGPQYRGFTNTHNTRQDSSGREISPTQRPLRDSINIHKKQILTSPVGFEPAIPASVRPQTHGLDRKATSTGDMLLQPQNTDLQSPCVSYSARKYVTPSRRGTNAAANRHATYRQLMAARHNKTIRKTKVIIKINDRTTSLWYVHNNEFSLCY